MVKSPQNFYCNFGVEIISITIQWELSSLVSFKKKEKNAGV
jgi:hypothetical protein